MNNWDNRYKNSEYIYGKEPNQFFKQEIMKLKPGKLLLLGEGEGRNGTFAAKKGWNVDAVDLSEVGREKAAKLSRSQNVIFNYIIDDVVNFTPDTDKFDVIALIYLHLKKDEKEIVFRKIKHGLKKDGKLILEVFDHDQLKHSSGGPKEIELLYSLEEIVELCIDFEFDYFAKEIITLNEGTHHLGEAAVIRFVGTKNNK